MRESSVLHAASPSPLSQVHTFTTRAKTPVIARTGRALIAVLALLGAGSAAAAGKNVVGDWLSPPEDNWPLVAIHAVLTPDGRVLTYGSNNAGPATQQTGYFIYDVWDPSAGLSGGHVTLNNMTLTDLFCSAQVLLPESGDVFLAGGDNWDGTAVTSTGNKNTNLFRYTDDTLTRGNDMNKPRWYATTTVLANGEIYIQGGKNGNTYAEVRAADGSFDTLTNVPTADIFYWYPRNFLAPDGRVFGFDAKTGRMYYVTTVGAGSKTLLGYLPSTYIGKYGSPAMFRPGWILQLSGTSSGAAVIDINGPTPEVSATQSMSSKRKWVTATVLADGRVLATGGSGTANELNNVNNNAEIWNPDTGKWIIGPEGSRPRLYHSTAIMLPDASVLVAGGGTPGPLTNLHAEIYYPPYLYNTSGNFAARPSITFAPDTLNVDETFSMGASASNISRVTLVKTGAVTHSFNMDQRFLELSFTEDSGTLFVQTPANLNIAPPGYYLLFVFNSQGVPSIGKIVRINIT
jgi:hypothetical protein